MTLSTYLTSAQSKPLKIPTRTFHQQEQRDDARLIPHLFHDESITLTQQQRRQEQENDEEMLKRERQWVAEQRDSLLFWRVTSRISTVLRERVVQDADLRKQNEQCLERMIHHRRSIMLDDDKNDDDDDDYIDSSDNRSFSYHNSAWSNSPRKIDCPTTNTRSRSDNSSGSGRTTECQKEYPPQIDGNRNGEEDIFTLEL